MSIVDRRRIVLTGKVAGHSRVTAQAALRAAGAIIQDTVGKDTDILVTGDRVGPAKIAKAKALGIEIVPWAEALNGKKTSGARAPAPPRAPMPAVRQWAPMLCQAGDLPSGGRFSFELKWDGQRGLATIKDGDVYLQSRSGKTSLAGSYPDIVEELSRYPDCVLDGELVTMGDELGFLPAGCDPDPQARFIVFDILMEGDQETTSRPLSQRREILQYITAGGDCYCSPSPVFEDGEALLEFAREHGLEGVVAKDNDSKYIEGGRGPAWVKVKLRLGQEFLVLGFTEGEGSRASTFGALILGYFDGGAIKYAGRVGTGFDDKTLREVMDVMTPLVRGTSAFDDDLPSDLRGSTWIEPGVIANVEFQKWTEDGRLWHPSFQGLRTDKAPEEVVKET